MFADDMTPKMFTNKMFRRCSYLKCDEKAENSKQHIHPSLTKKVEWQTACMSAIRRDSSGESRSSRCSISDMFMLKYSRKNRERE